MAQEVTIAGATYQNVPSIRVPDSNNVYHPFVDPSPTTATAADVASGKVFIAADGTQTTGTASGGGGGTDVEDGIIARTISGAYSNSRVTAIGQYAFYSCIALTTANFQAATTIGTYAFYNCKALTTANFPAVTTIGSSAFRSCKAVTTASFPALLSSTAIYLYAFYGCYSLASLYLLGSDTCGLSNTNAFGTTPMSVSTYLGYFGSIYVRQSLLASWKAKTNWAAYSARFVGLTDAQIAALG